MGAIKKFEFKALRRPAKRKPADVHAFQKMGKRGERDDLFSSQLKDVSALLKELLTELTVLTRMVTPLGGYYARSVAVLAASAVLAYESAQPRAIYLSNNNNAVQVPPANDVVIYLNSTNAVNSTNGYPLRPGQSIKLFLKENTQIWVRGSADTTLNILELY